MADKTDLITLHKSDDSQGNEEITITYQELPDGTYGMVVGLPRFQYISGEVKTPGGASATCTIPTGANFLWIDAEGGDIYYEINPAGDASANSPGFVGEKFHMPEGPLSNLNSLKVFGAAGAIAHIRYYK